MRVVLPAQPESFGDLARRLYEDVDGAFAAEYRQYFESLSEMASRKSHEPLTPDEHATNSALLECTSLCAEVIVAVTEAMRARRNGTAI